MIRLIGLCLGGLATLTIALALIRLIRRSERQNLNELDELVARLLMESIAKRLGSSPPRIRQLLSGTLEDPDLSKRFDETVGGVELQFRRASGPNDVELRVRLSYEDGESSTASLKYDWDTLPAAVRGEFLRSGNRVLTLDWVPPWRAN